MQIFKHIAEGHVFRSLKLHLENISLSDLYFHFNVNVNGASTSRLYVHFYIKTNL